MIFLEILLFTSKLILFLYESNQNHNFKEFFVCNCVCVLTCVHFQVILVWLRRALIFAIMRIGSSVNIDFMDFDFDLGIFMLVCCSFPGRLIFYHFSSCQEVLLI